MPTESASTNYIILGKDLLSQTEQLKAYLSALYLGPEQIYQLQFPYSYLRHINKIFDDIIFRYKIRGVFFQFIFVDEIIASKPSSLDIEA